MGINRRIKITLRIFVWNGIYLDLCMSQIKNGCESIINNYEGTESLDLYNSENFIRTPVPFTTWIYNNIIIFT